MPADVDGGLRPQERKSAVVHACFVVCVERVVLYESRHTVRQALCIVVGG